MNIWEIWFDVSVRIMIELYYLPYKMIAGND